MTATIGSLATALRPADSQLVFRAVLEALARPGTAMALPAGPLRMLAPSDGAGVRTRRPRHRSMRVGQRDSAFVRRVPALGRRGRHD